MAKGATGAGREEEVSRNEEETRFYGGDARGIPGC